MNRLSLRARLTFVILAPLLVIAALVGTWAYRDAQVNAGERFDRSLLSTALAISQDTALSGGDALSRETRDLLRDTSGGAVFYHVYAPDGVFVTGYATPPLVPRQQAADSPQIYYDATYQGATVRALRLTQTMSIDGLQGPFTFTVWQNTNVRDGFVRSRSRPVFLIIASMIGALGVIVWFGVRLGLTPLLDLEEAIERRSASDLSPIKRRIPTEVSGIVGRLNALLSEMSRTLDAKDAFISDAAHQLRNPIAGVLSLAESVQAAKTPEAVKQRTTDLLHAARDAGALANNLLTLERAQATPIAGAGTVFEATALLGEISAKFAPRAIAADVKFTSDLSINATDLRGDPVMFEQAILNMLNNALAHGGATCDEIRLGAEIEREQLIVSISDTGRGIADVDMEKALGRFSQVGPSAGSGLGLPIAKAVAESFGGSIALRRSDKYFVVSLQFPKATTASQPLAASIH